MLSDSEVSTHLTETVQKIKRFFSQIKIIEKFTFLEIIKFAIFSKGKLLFSKLLFTALTHEQDFEVHPGFPGICTICQKNENRLESPLDFVSGISRPQKRDQTEKYNGKYFGLFPIFYFSKAKIFSQKRSNF